MTTPRPNAHPDIASAQASFHADLIEEVAREIAANAVVVVGVSGLQPGKKARRLLDAQKNAGLELTESFAMIPISSVSGYYFAHPEAEYFGVARIGRDQLEDYARRRGIPLADAERYLRANLGY